MAKVISNPIVRGIQGSIGGLVFRGMPDGKTWVSGKPDFSNRKFSVEQKSHQGRFREAAAYAREAAKTQPIYAELAAGTVKSPYNVALSDWFHAPEILELDVSGWHGEAGGVIRIQAIDNVRVTQVNVVIKDSAGVVLEQGGALSADGTWWNYTTTAPVPEGARLIVTARDLPGHIAQMDWG
jgi:hypothetical protein